MSLDGRGIKCIYDRNNVAEHLYRFMREKIRSSDMLLFVASEQSILSEFCHFEIGCALEKRSLSQKILPICIDEFIHRVDKQDLPLNNRDDFWENIRQIREVSISDFSYVKTSSDNHEFERLVDSIIADAIKK